MVRKEKLLVPFVSMEAVQSQELLKDTEEQAVLIEMPKELPSSLVASTPFPTPIQEATFVATESKQSSKQVPTQIRPI